MTDDRPLQIAAVRHEDGEWTRSMSHSIPDVMRGMAEMVAKDLWFMGWDKSRFDKMLDEEIDRMPERVAAWEATWEKKK